MLNEGKCVRWVAGGNWARRKNAMQLTTHLTLVLPCHVWFFVALFWLKHAMHLIHLTLLLPRHGVLFVALFHPRIESFVSPASVRGPKK
jgi:hypothetical protein